MASDRDYAELEAAKLRAETTKLEAETAKLNAERTHVELPWWKRPAYIVLAVPVVVACLSLYEVLLTGRMQMKRDRLVAEIEELKQERNSLRDYKELMSAMADNGWSIGLRNQDGEQSYSLGIVSYTDEPFDNATHADRLTPNVLSKLNEIGVRACYGDAISDEVLLRFDRLGQLRDLDLTGSSVTSDGLKVLLRIRTLRRLHLRNHELDQAAIQTLSKLDYLRFLNLTDATIPAGSKEKLRDALPECDFEFGQRH